MVMLRKITLITVFFALHITANCQTESGLNLITSAKDFQIQERVVLSLDQDFYLAGENINFLALTFDAALQIPIDFSSVLYVELFNQDNNVVSAKKYLLKKGEGKYEINIPRKLETGYYYIRAYTNYMKNFGPGIFFTKRVKVANAFYKNNNLTKTESLSGELDLEISAEGGKIIYNTENKVAFYSSNFNDHILARLYEKDSVIAEVDTRTGLGIFTFTPTPNNKYRIEAVAANRKKTTIQLKDILESGVICKLDSLKKNSAFLSVKSINISRKPLTLSVENNGLLYKSPVIINTPETSFNILLPDGLNKITINSDDEEVSTRLVYIKPNAKFEISANLDKAKAFPGDTVSLHITATISDSTQFLVALNLGNTSTAPYLNELIESSLYVSTLASFTNKISVNELNHFYSNTQNINDYILKFQNTEKVNTKLKNITYLPEITNDMVTGSISSQNEQSVVGNKIIYGAFVDSICWINSCKTDSLGKFTLTLPLDYQGNELIVTVKDTTNDYFVKIDNEFYPNFLKVTKENYYPDSSLKDIIESRMLNLQINDAYSELHKSSESLRPKLRFYGYPSSEYQFKKYVNLPNFEEFAFEIVKHLGVYRNGEQINFRVLNEKSTDIIGENPLFIFDGVPLFKTEKLASIPSEKLKSIRVVANKFFLGSESFDGVIDITSKTKSFDLADMDKNSTRVFFSPIIAENNDHLQQNSRIPNYISTIYFNKIKTSSDGKDLKIQLPQNTGNYSLSIFGYTKTGEWSNLTLPNVLSICH